MKSSNAQSEDPKSLGNLHVSCAGWPLCVRKFVMPVGEFIEAVGDDQAACAPTIRMVRASIKMASTASERTACDSVAARRNRRVLCLGRHGAMTSHSTSRIRARCASTRACSVRFHVPSCFATALAWHICRSQARGNRCPSGPSITRAKPEGPVAQALRTAHREFVDFSGHGGNGGGDVPAPHCRCPRSEGWAGPVAANRPPSMMFGICYTIYDFS